MLALDPETPVPSASATAVSFTVPAVSVPSHVSVRDGWVLVPVWRAAGEHPLLVSLRDDAGPCDVGTAQPGVTSWFRCPVGRHWSISAEVDGAVLGGWSA